MDLLAAQTGARRFVVGGICSAADVAFDAAAVEPRIDGLLLLDGPCHRTPGWWWRHLGPRLLQPRRIWRWWRSRRQGDAQPSMADFRDFAAPADARARLRDLVGRDVRMLFVFTGGAYGYFNHARQLAAAYGNAARAPQVTLAHWPDCDHTFYLRAGCAGGLLVCAGRFPRSLPAPATPPNRAPTRSRARVWPWAVTNAF